MVTSNRTVYWVGFKLDKTFYLIKFKKRQQSELKLLCCWRAILDGPNDKTFYQP